ncbi:hypothetical protein [Iamia sp.]|uniref:hypothetical protein n=1 Tax=Iamia sp. TaxID=2722710 RepID=UPI002C131792|nr:hypothetical protein [Iamia sp.]HXH57571.1 hypothetical protein [Iamia sp.]
MSRTRYLLGTAAIVVLGLGLVSLLGVVFGREGAVRDPERRVRFSFDGGAPGMPRGLDVVSGGLAIRDGRLVATEAKPDAPALALAEHTRHEGRILVTAAGPTAGWGLILRAEGAERYWFAAVPPAGGPLEIGYTSDGEATVVSRARATVPDGAGVDVRFDANRIDVRVDGNLVVSARGRWIAGRQVGLRSTAPGVAWDDLEIGPRPRPVVRSDG